MMATRLLLLGFAGAAGTIARYGVHQLVVSRGAHQALGTFAVNVLGCLALGVAWSMLRDRGAMDGDLRLLLFTGFLGAFTTFSALMYDSALLARDGAGLVVAGNIALQLVAGALLLGLGVMVGRAL